MYSKNELPADTADGLMHFYISQASWHNPSLFLDHWGKPLFILLSSPFAQFGFNGMFFFNLLVFTSICITAFKIFVKLNVNLLLASIFPIAMILIEDFSITIFGGLTEPLFNLFLLISFYFLLEKKWVYFALAVSLLPYLRSEGQLVFILALFYLVYFKEFKTLAFLVIFPIVYGLAGILVYSDFWWYFTKSAYSYSNNIYGTGEWSHYFTCYKSYLGNVGLYFFIVSICVIIFLILKRNWKKLQFLQLFYAYGIFLGIVLFHSYLWANGKYGSLGLTRIATQGMPVFFIMAIYYSELVFQKMNLRLKHSIFLLISFLCLFSRFNSKKTFPLKAQLFEKQILNAGKYLKENLNNFKKIHYHHPLIPYKMGLNPLINKNKLQIYYGQNIEHDFNNRIKKGDLLIWDSKFGPVEAGMPLEKISNLKQLTLIQAFTYFKDTNKNNGVFIYQFTTTTKENLKE